MTMSHKDEMTHVLVVGAGGIGSTMVELLIPALRRCGRTAKIHLMDSDCVSASNLGHQRFIEADIGFPKVKALATRHDRTGDSVCLIAHEEDLREPTQLEGWDAIIVAVDSPLPRRLVHACEIPWLDLRCAGGAWLSLTYEDDRATVDMLTPDHEPASCQLDGAAELGNLEFGFSGAATFGAQWCFQLIRMLDGEEVRLPRGMMFSLAHGPLPMPEAEVCA